MKDEALKLALEALEEYSEQEDLTRAADQAITAIRQALASPVQEPVAYCEIHYLPEPCAQCSKEHEGYNTPPAAQPAPVQEPMAHIVGEIDHTGKVWKPANPAVPNEITDNSESPEYRSGWNDCRALMLEMRKP